MFLKEEWESVIARPNIPPTLLTSIKRWCYMTSAADIFQSPFDDKYYFWLGDRVSSGYEEYTQAHAALTKHLEEAHGNEKKGCPQSRC